MTTMNVGIFTPSYPGVTGEGGIGTYTRHLGLELCALGHGVHVLTPGPSEVTARDGSVYVHTVRNHHLPVVDRLLPGAGACYRVGAAMRRLVARYRLDVVEFPNWEGFGIGFAPRRRVPMVVRLSTSSAEAGLIDGVGRDRGVRWDVRRERWLAKAADVLVTHSDAHRRCMADEIGVEGGRIAVAPLGVPAFPEFERPPRRGPGLGIVYLGRMERRKGTLDLLRAMPDVLRAVPEARLTLIGADRPHCPGGRSHARYADEELPAEVRGQIEFLGRLPEAEVDRRLQGADLFVAPSLYESFGMIFLEAMRWGTPVIGTRAGGIPEIVEDGVSGVLVKPGCPDELARAVVALLSDEDRRRRVGEAGRRRVESDFSVTHMARRAADLYTRTLEARQR